MQQGSHLTKKDNKNEGQKFCLFSAEKNEKTSFIFLCIVQMYMGTWYIPFKMNIISLFRWDDYETPSYHQKKSNVLSALLPSSM